MPKMAYQYQDQQQALHEMVNIHLLIPIQDLHRKGKIHINSDTLSREQSIMSQPTQEDIAEGTLSKIFSPKLCKIDSCKTCKIDKVKCPTGKERTQTITNQSIFQLQALSTRADEKHLPIHS